MGMQEFVNDLVTLQEKLDNMGKTLYIFILKVYRINFII